MDFSLFPKSKILLITNDYPPRKGGVSWYYDNLVRRLNADNTQINADALRKIEVLNLGKWTMTPLWPLIVFPLILKTHKLKTEAWWVGQVLPVGTVVWLLTYIWRKPYFVSTHGMDILVPLRSRRKRWLVKKILERASLITANSEWTKRKIMEHYFNNVIPAPYRGTGQAPAGIQTKKRNRFWCLFSGSPIKSGMTDEGNEKIIVVYPEPKSKRSVAPQEVNALRLKLGIPEDAKVLLSVGRLARRKGIDRVLAALPEVWMRVPGVHYVIVGDGEMREELQQFIHNKLIPTIHGREYLGSKNKVIFTGSVREEELSTYYAMAHTFIFLPRELGGDVEGFGTVYLEADQYRMPIVGCISGGTGEALAKCENVILVANPDDPKEVSEKICHAFQ